MTLVTYLRFPPISIHSSSTYLATSCKKRHTVNSTQSTQLSQLNSVNLVDTRHTPTNNTHSPASCNTKTTYTIPSRPYLYLPSPTLIPSTFLPLTSYKQDYLNPDFKPYLFSTLCYSAESFARHIPVFHPLGPRSYCSCSPITGFSNNPSQCAPPPFTSTLMAPASSTQRVPIFARTRDTEMLAAPTPRFSAHCCLLMGRPPPSTHLSAASPRAHDTRRVSPTGTQPPTVTDIPDTRRHPRRRAFSARRASTSTACASQSRTAAAAGSAR